LIFLIENSEVVIKQEQGAKPRVEIDYVTELEDMDEELISEHPGRLCRLCASAVNEVVYIFSGAGKKQHIAEKINMCLPVTVSYLYNLVLL
jgi:hypothetical protein